MSTRKLAEATLSKILLAEDLDHDTKDNYMAILAVKTDTRNSATRIQSTSSEYQAILMMSNVSKGFKDMVFGSGMEGFHSDERLGDVKVLKLYYNNNYKIIMFRR